MVEDKELVLRDTKREDLARIAEMEQGEARKFIISYSLEQHQAAFAKPEIVYKSIWRGGELVGFLILVLDPDGRSVEFRRVVVSKPGRGYGKSVVSSVDELCRRELDRSRIWLDVFETNERARHVYEQCGYRQFEEAKHEGRRLLLYEKAV